MSKIWTPEEDELLVSLYGSKSLSEIGEELGRTEGAVAGRVNKLTARGVLKLNNKRWTDDEKALALSLAQTMTVAEIGERLERSETAVRGMLRKSRKAENDVSQRRRVWTPEEDSLILQLRGKTPHKEIAKKLGCSPRALGLRFAELKEEGYEVPPNRRKYQTIDRETREKIVELIDKGHSYRETAETLNIANNGAVARLYNQGRKYPSIWESDVAGWIAHMKMRGLTQTTINFREYHIRRLSTDLRKPWQKVRYVDLVTWMGSNNWAAETHNSVRESIISFYRWAVEMELLDKSPAEKLPKMKVAFQGARPVDEETYHAVLERADERVRIMLRLAGELGLRRAEIAQVHANDLTEHSDGWELTVHGKGGKVRYIPIGGEFATLILNQANGGFVFQNTRSLSVGHISPHYVGTIISTALGDEWSAHKLRHRALTRAYDHSKDLLLTAALAGHSNIEITRRHYVKTNTNALRDLVEAIRR